MYKDSSLKDGISLLQLPSKKTWKYNIFTDRGSEYIEDLNMSVAKQGWSFSLKYNTIYKTKTELKRSMTIIDADLNDRGSSSTGAPFSAFASVCP